MFDQNHTKDIQDMLGHDAQVPSGVTTRNTTVTFPAEASTGDFMLWEKCHFNLAIITEEEVEEEEEEEEEEA